MSAATIASEEFDTNKVMAACHDCNKWHEDVCKFAPDTSLEDLRKLYLETLKKNNSEVLVEQSPPLEETLDFGHGPQEGQDEISSASNIILAPDSLEVAPGEDPQDPIEPPQPKKQRRSSSGSFGSSGKRRSVLNYHGHK